MTHVTGVFLIDVTRARNGWIWTSRHMRHCVSLGTAITDDDTNEEIAPVRRTMPRRSELGSEWLITYSAEKLAGLGAITPPGEDRSSSDEKLHFASPSSICSR
jgi:hypothetical protein